MCNSCRQISLGFTAEAVPEGQHICYIFNDEQERRRTMSRFLKAGLTDNERVLCLIDTMTTEEFGDCMEELGLDVRKRSGEFIISDATAAYCSQGQFSMPEMLQALEQFYRKAMDDGFRGARVTGEASWALEGDRVSGGDFMEYEVRVNQLLVDYPVTACCQYDARRFDGATIMDVLSVHPVMIVRGQIVKNPYYIEPEEFLKQLKTRHYD